jgi:hypothetical protein
MTFTTAGPASMPQVSIKITIKGVSQVVSATHPRVFVGRDAGACNMVVPDNSLSRRHAEVFYRGNQFFIRDLGSSNGTWVNNAAVDMNPVLLSPGQQVFLGQIPMKVEWISGQQQGAATASGEMPSVLKEKVEARRLHTQAMLASVPSSAERSGVLPVITTDASAEFPYRRHTQHAHADLSIGLRGNTFHPDSVLDGVVDFTAAQNATIASMGIELLEFQHASDARGQVWDRALLKQGPWRARKSDRLSIAFQLKVPPALSMTNPKAHWELRAYADINWEFDVSVRCAVLIR